MIYKQGRWWWIDVQRDGRRHRRSLRTTSKRVAEAKAARLLEQIEAGDTLLGRSLERVDLVLEDYQGDMLRQGLSVGYVEDHMMRLRRIFAGEKRLSVLTTAWAGRRIREVAIEHNHSAGTQNCYRFSLSALVTWLQSQGRWGSSNPVSMVRKARSSPGAPRKRALSEEELEALVGSAPIYRSACYAIAAGCGLRRQELQRIRWDDFDLDPEGGWLHLRPEVTKERRESWLPVPSWSMRRLLRWRELRPNPGLVWPAGHHGNQGMMGVPANLTLRRDCEAAGIPVETSAGVVCLHGMRATLATMLARSGVPQHVAGRVLRHKDPRVTAKHYLRIEARDTRAAADLLDDRLRRRRATG